MKRLLALTLILLLLLTGCGGSSTSVNMKAEAPAAAAPMEAAEEMIMNAAGSVTEDTAETTSTALPESRKWIITVYMDAETEDLDTAISSIDERITAMDGYVEDQRVYNGSSYSSRRYRNASLTIRIPAEKVDQFTQALGGIANVISKEKNLEDITLTYVSTESRMKALLTEESRLLELLAEAETMSDLLEIEARLTDVRYELERVTSQLRVMDNQVNYSTIYLNLNEVQEYTPVEEPTVWERITGGFKNSLEGVGEGFVDVFVWLIVVSPYLVVFGAVAAVAIVLIKRVLRIRRKKKDIQK